MDAKLVDMIVQRVVETLRAQGLAGPGGPATAPAVTPPVAPVPAGPAAPPKRPPVVWEFTAGGNPVLKIDRKTPSPSAPRGPAKVFVTAETLAQRVGAQRTGVGVVELAHNEFLTPNAEELAERRNWAVRQAPRPVLTPALAPVSVEPGSSVPAPSASTVKGAPIGVVVQASNDKTANVLSALGHDRLNLVDYGAGQCWMCNIKSLCEAVVSGQARLGVALAPYGADAVALANKIKGIRAVQGTRVDSVSAGVRHMDANVLVLEHALSSFHEMRQMVRAFVAPRAGAGQPQLLEYIGKLEGR